MYNETGLQLNRGTFNSQMSGNVSGTVMHSYKNMLDTIATISAPAYFPDNFNADPTEIFVGDALQIVGSDGLEIFEITSLSPVTVVANSGNFPGGITTTTINATTSITTPNYFGTNMTLTGDITANKVNALTEVFAPLIRTTPITGQVTSANITATFIGTNTIDATTYVSSNGFIHAIGDITSDTGNIIATTGNVVAGGAISAPTGNITTVNAATVGTSAIYIGGGSTPETYFDEWSATVAVTGPWASPINTFMKVQRVNQMLYYYIREIPAAPATIADAMFIADGTIPAPFRPAILRDVGPFTTINNGVYQLSSVECRSLGGIVISGSLQNSTPFTGAGTAGFYDIQFVVSQN
jgi:hypothetical protein